MSQTLPIVPKPILPNESLWSLVPARCITMNDGEYERCAANMRQGGFKNVSRFPAIVGRDVAERFRADRSLLTIKALSEIEHASLREAHSSLPSWGGVGCYLSHVALWEEAAKSPHGIIIVEADAVPRHENAFQTAATTLDLLWRKGHNPDMFMIGYLAAVASSDVEQVSNVRRATDRVYGSTTYYVSPAGARKLLKNAFPIEVQVDSYTGYLIELEKLNMMTLVPSIVDQQNPVGTTIQTKAVAHHDAHFGGGHFSESGRCRQALPASLVLFVLAIFLFCLAALLMTTTRGRSQASVTAPPTHTKIRALRA